MSRGLFFQRYSRILCSTLELWWGLFALSGVLFIVSAAMFPLVEPDSATYVVTILTMGILLVLLGAIGSLLFVCRKVHART